ncbi:MOSC domain-containing protein [Mycolicibacterium peregrinum]|uniref:MOSC and FAD-binding oxidoreductase domain-containing protein n=2 Tax=Mycolicibacterium peregrinum TaxID=43304 RepID=UPI000A14F0DF|nr:MOSC and FAD-binding oxidoreductase domain-containing protein [Mycolicibacterium peregrinum]MCV7200529.1 MOSC domain-containing protein [Mycolicibacterium peregrinum]ORW55992.1 sulfurase [Mycolicibacterium peregrinum]
MARLLSVNVGMPKDLSWQGKTIHTGIYKEPVEGPVLVRRLNVDGDGQGDLNGHGGENRAVMVYQTESYDYWRRELGRDGLSPGQFGENFTVSGLPDDTVCIGDRYRIGDAEFEVTQPRVTCFRVGMRLGIADMPRLLVSHHRPGFYFRVVTEGQVCAGDQIVQTRQGRHRLSVAAVDAMLYLPDPDKHGMRLAAEIPALSPGWAQSFHELLSPDPPAGPQSAWRGFRPMRIGAIRSETSNVASFELLADEPLPAPLPGQYVTVRIATPGQPPVVRSYSLSGAPAGDRYRISVKREPHGLISQWFHHTATVGTSVDIGAPRGDFHLDDSPGPLILMSAGIGVTPVLAMLHHLATTSSSRRIIWVHTTHDESSHAFRDEIATLLMALPNAERHDFYTAAPGRRLDDTRIAALGLPANATAFVCGPSKFMEDMASALTAVGITRIHSELFGTRPAVNPGSVPTAQARRPHPPAGEPGTGAAVTFARAGLTVPWSPRYRTVLELAEACDVPTQYSCRSGVCHLCATEVVTGSFDYVTDPLDPPAPGSALICCAAPSGELVLDL